MPLVRVRPDDGGIFQGRRREAIEHGSAFLAVLDRARVVHCVPVQEAAIRQIGSRSMAIDVYIWLAYRLHRLDKPTPITWAALYQQFGAGFTLIRQFRARFRETLALALAAYPDAHVSEEEGGLLLYPSPPPVGERRGKLGSVTRVRSAG